MGHLVNPIGLRLGYIAQWDSVWYTEHLYYPQYLHKLYKLKLYILYILRKRLVLVVLGLIHSHIKFIKQRRLLSIYLFNYYSLLEIQVQEFAMQEFFFIKKMIKIKNRAIFAQYGILFLLLYFYTFTGFNYLSKYFISNWNWTIWKQKKMYKFIKILDPMYLQIHLLQWKTWPFNVINSTMRSRFLYILGFFHKFFFKKNLEFWDSILEFWFYLLYIRFTNPLIEFKSKILSSIFSYFFNLKTKINFIRIKNDEITPKFLARFLALKLVQKFSINDLLSPLKTELRIVAFRLRKKYNLIKNSVLLTQTKLTNKFKSFLNLLVKNFNSNFYQKFVLEFNWVTFEIFNTFFDKKNKINNILYVKIKALFYFFYEISNIGFKIEFAGIFNNVNILFESNKILIFNQISYYFFNNFIWFSFINFSEKIIKQCFSVFINFYKYHLINNKFILNDILKINKLKQKISDRLHDSNSLLMGFKLQFAGRFSRKQRSSFYWVKEGLLPLNTLSCNIEFGMYTIPIINSAITVKVWFYKQYTKGEINNFFGNLFKYETIS